MEKLLMGELDKLKKQLQSFAKERDWDQFHSPKNLSMALSVEVAELVEHFQWLTEEQSKQLDDKTLAKVRDEIADVQVYLIRLADKLGIDILGAVEAKMLKNEAKYPTEMVRGSARKYTEYKDEDK